VFASTVNTQFDADPKRYRWAADWALGLAVVLEACTGLFPSLFLPVAALANIGKNVAWMSASATRASIHQSFAKQKNLADITAKAASQTVAASVAGTVLGVSLTPLLNQQAELQVAAAALLSCGHVFFSYCGLQAVVLSTLNPQRACRAVAPAALLSDDFAWALLAGPAQVAAAESFAWAADDANIVVGASVELFDGAAVQAASDSAARRADGHLIFALADRVHVLYLVHATPEQVLRGFIHALLVSKRFSGNTEAARQWMSDQGLDDARLLAALSAAGWDCKHLFIESRRARLSLKCA